MRKLVIIVMALLCLSLVTIPMAVQGNFLFYSTNIHAVEINNGTIIDIDPDEYDWQNITGAVLMLKIAENESLISKDLSFDMITINQTELIYLHETDGNSTTLVRDSGWHELRMKFPEGNTTMEVWYGDELVWNFYYRIRDYPVIEHTPEGEDAQNHTTQQDKAQDEANKEQEDNITRLQEESTVGLSFHIYDSFFAIFMTAFIVLFGVGFGVIARNNVIRESYAISRNPMLRIIVFSGVIILIFYVALMVVPTIFNMLNYWSANNLINNLDISEAKKAMYHEQIRDIYPVKWSVVVNNFVDTIRWVIWGFLFIGSAVFIYRRIDLEHMLKNIVEFNTETKLYDVDGESNVGVLKKSKKRGWWWFINVRDNSVKSALLQLLKLDMGLAMVFIGGNIERLRMRFDGIDAIACDKLEVSDMDDPEVKVQIMKNRAKLKKRHRNRFHSTGSRIRKAIGKKFGIEERPPEKVVKVYLASLHSKGYRLIVDDRQIEGVDALVEEAENVILEACSIRNTGEAKEFSKLITNILSPMARVSAKKHERKELEKSMEMFDKVQKAMRQIEKDTMAGKDSVKGDLDE